MKKALLTLLLIAPLTSWSQLITVSSFSNIQYWTGAGTNSAALVLEFGSPSTPDSITWGYRWNGSATLEDLIFSVAGAIPGGPAPRAGADPRLTFDVSFFSFDDVTGYFVNSISYNQIGLPAPWSQTVRSMENNYFVDLTYPALYSLAGSGIWSASLFSPANVGMSDLTLGNGGWYGFVQVDEFEGDYAFAQPASAVPEPRVWALLAAGATLLLLVKRNP
jgi:hypothetical protein